MAKAQELAGDRIVEVAAGDVGGQMLAAGLVDEVRMDVVPVVFGSGKRYFGSARRTAPVGGSRRGDSGQPGASPALSRAPLTDLSGYAKKSTANGDTRSRPRLRLRIAARDRRGSRHPASDYTLNREEPVKRPGRLLVARVEPPSFCCGLSSF